jgi:hypothetical protein
MNFPVGQLESVEHLASVHCAFESSAHAEEAMPIKDVYKTMSSHITWSLTDRAAANYAAIRIVNEAFETTLVEVNCHLHPLDSIATKCKSTLKLMEITKSKLFGSGCRAEKVILALNKMRFKDSKGDPHGFRVFLDDQNLPQSLVVRYRGNRLHVLFKLAAVYITHYTHIKTYLTTRCLHNSELKTSLIKDYTDDPITKLQLRVLAIIGKILSGPWFKRFYRSQDEQVHHMDAFIAIKECYSCMEVLASKEKIHLEDITQDFFGDPIDVSDKVLWTLDGSSVDEFSMMLKAVLTAIMTVVQRQYKNYYSMEMTDELRSKLASARTHNMDSEEVMGMFSASQARAPRATLLFISSKIRSKKNKTVDFILSHPEPEIIVMTSIAAAAKLKRRAQVSASELKKELSRRIADKMQKKERH